MPLAVPPAETVSVPPLSTVPRVTPPDDTNWLPAGFTVPPLAVPPASTYSFPPNFTVSPTAVPRAYSAPPLLTTVPLSVPPAEIVSVPPLSTVPRAIPPDEDNLVAAGTDRGAARHPAGENRLLPAAVDGVAERRPVHPLDAEVVDRAAAHRP